MYTWVSVRGHTVAEDEDAPYGIIPAQEMMGRKALYRQMDFAYLQPNAKKDETEVVETRHLCYTSPGSLKRSVQMAVDYSDTLGRVIRKKRMQYGLSLRDLAAKVGVHYATIDRIEMDQFQVVDPNTVVKVARELHLDELYLLSLNGAGVQEEDIRVIARAANKMDDEQRQHMMNVLRDSFTEAFKDTESDDLDDRGEGYLNERV